MRPSFTFLLLYCTGLFLFLFWGVLTRQDLTKSINSKLYLLQAAVHPKTQTEAFLILSSFFNIFKHYLLLSKANAKFLGKRN